MESTSRIVVKPNPGERRRGSVLAVGQALHTLPAAPQVSQSDVFEMTVAINQTGEDELPAGVDDIGALGNGHGCSHLR